MINATSTADFNPFSLMMEPKQALQMMERSQQLHGLRRRILRPLDRPWIPFTNGVMDSRAAFDAAIDAESLD